MFARVIVGINATEIDRVFDYEIGEEWLGICKKGVRVMVPFGFRDKKTEGYVLGISNEVSGDYKGPFKKILEVLDDGKIVFTEHTIYLAEFMQKKYFCTLSVCLQTIMPSGIKTKTSWNIGLKDMYDPMPELNEETQRIYDYLVAEKGSSYNELEKQFGNKVVNHINKLISLRLVYKYQKVWRGEYKNNLILYSINKDNENYNENLEKIKNDTRRKRQLEILELLEKEDGILWTELKKQGISSSPLKKLEELNMIVKSVETKHREVYNSEDYTRTKAFIPNEEQEMALDKIYETLDLPEKKPIILHGVTGSGKTEIYMQAIEKNIQEGKEAIVLVPEIALTSQIMDVFISRFGDKVSITHSRLSQGERVDQWRKARDGEISIMIGPRSALFAPFENLGIIIIDEFHEGTYISDTTPKYDGREIAIELAKSTNALLILGSATPSVDFYYRGLQGEFDIVTLKKRAGGGEIPHINLIDMRFELANGNRSPFSQKLHDAIKENLKKGEQTMLFLNRRGYATFISCRSCGHVMECSECELPYTYHIREDELMCHYCGQKSATPKQCPKCESKYIRFFGTGTQKIEEEARRLFPTARILRMDFDTTKGKMGFKNILETFRKGDGDILIGTQMIAKGHDFPNVTLMGIMAAETTLNTGGYLGAENTFQLITQSAGRAGRAKAGGKVYLQTYQPDEYSIKHGKNQDYAGFYKDEILIRKALDYTPFGMFFSVIMLGKLERDVIDVANKLFNNFNSNNKNRSFLVLKPTQTNRRKIDGDYGYRVLVQGKDERLLVEFVMQSVEWIKKDLKSNIYFNLTLNPRYIE